MGDSPRIIIRIQSPLKERPDLTCSQVTDWDGGLLVSRTLELSSLMAPF